MRTIKKTHHYRSLPSSYKRQLDQQSHGIQIDRLVMVLLCYRDSVCWCVVMMSHSYKDEVERQVQDELSQKTTENDECLPEVDTPNGSGIEEVKAFLPRNGSNSNGFRFPRSW